MRREIQKAPLTKKDKGEDVRNYIGWVFSVTVTREYAEPGVEFFTMRGYCASTTEV